MKTSDTLRATVQHRYAEAARRARAGAKSDCCGGSGACDPVAAPLYSTSDLACLPAEAVLSSLGCGNPTALIELEPGETVLDLGSGGGIDVLLSARRVGPAGKAYGLDMTTEMVSLSEDNARRAGVNNAEFLKGEIEAIPLPDASVDVIISNCVINLSADKERTLREAFRVLKPGGRFAVSDVVVRGDLPQSVRGNIALWVGCVAGALNDTEYKHLLAQSGFVEPTIEPLRVYRFDDAKALLDGAGLDSEVLAREIGGRVMGAFIRARKPDVL